MTTTKFHSARSARPRSLFGGIVILTLGTIAFAACSSRDGFDDPTTPELGGDSGTLKQCTAFRCSPDLKSVLATCDGNEEVVQTCPAEQGCGDGRCVDACQSATLSKGSIGCSFWTLPPDSVNEARGACYAAMVANTWDRPVNLTAEYGNAALDISKSIYTAEKSGENTTYTLLSGPLPPGQVALVFLSQAESSTEMRFVKCPDGVVPAVKADPIRHGTTSRSSAFHLVADAPVAAYSIFPYGGADSMYPTASLLLPVSSWDTRYISVSTSNLTRTGTPGTEPRTLQIVANEDATTVTIKPTVSILEGEDVAAARFGESGSWTLSRGQVLQISQADNTSGSPILSDKPIGVFGGSSCAFLPGETMFCDLTQQQLAPFSQWGTQYALVPYETRIVGLHGEAPAEQVPYSFVGAASGTVLTYEPARPRGAPETLEAGQVVSFFTDQIVTVKSQDDKHPFHAAVYMTGSQFNGGLEGLGKTVGDPDFVNVVPTDQFLDRYVFFTDYTFPETSLTIVRRKTASGFVPVDLECAGEVTGFQPLGTSGELEYAWVRLTRNFNLQTFAKGACGYGRHEARSAGTFSLTVWGMGRDASYGYAGGMGSRPVNSAPLPTVN